MSQSPNPTDIARARARIQVWRRQHQAHLRPMLLALAEAGIPVRYFETDVAVLTEVPVRETEQDGPISLWIASPEQNAELNGDDYDHWTVSLIQDGCETLDVWTDKSFVDMFARVLRIYEAEGGVR